LKAKSSGTRPIPKSNAASETSLGALMAHDSVMNFRTGVLMTIVFYFSDNGRPTAVMNRYAHNLNYFLKTALQYNQENIS
jgi:hypothetical protein